MKLSVFGFGQVGRALCRQSLGMNIPVVSVADSSGVLLAPNSTGFTSTDLDQITEAKSQGSPMSSLSSSFECVNPLEAVERLQSHQPAVLADCSANNGAGDYLLPAQERGIAVALANKKPLTGPIADWEALTSDRDLIRFESTVGAGLPVISSLRRLLDSGDVVTSIEGQLSGTLGYILSALEHGEKFSSVVVDAKSKGFTEPDPRDDLSGLDVARKALIMARGLGQKLDLSDIDIEALYPAEMADLPLEEFMQRLPELDSHIDSKVSAAANNNKKLRYAATVNDAGIKVGLVEVGEDSPLFSLQGTDNLISFKTGWYDSSPTVIRGPGAGLYVTAAGVLSDAMDVHGSTVRKQWGIK